MVTEKYRIVAASADASVETFMIELKNTQWFFPGSKEPFQSLSDIITHIEGNGGKIMEIRREVE